MNIPNLAPCFSIVILAALFLSCGGSTSQSESSSESPVPVEICDYREQATRVWNNTIRERLGLATKIVDGDFEAADAEKITAGLDQFTEDWISIRDWVCREYQTAEPRSESVYRAKVDCLQRALADQQAIITSIQNGETGLLSQLEALMGNLESCR